MYHFYCSTHLHRTFSRFWDECFLFDANEKSNKIRLRIMDRKKPSRKHNANNGLFIHCVIIRSSFRSFLVDIVHAEVSIPFSYVTSTIYKQDIQITPQHPDSMIRIEVCNYLYAFSVRSMQ